MAPSMIVVIGLCEKFSHSYQQAVVLSMSQILTVAYTMLAGWRGSIPIVHKVDLAGHLLGT